ncbi:glycine-rich domain-containing protein [Mangrovibacterium sp.]|uniref:Ig-like domain-containing protein n=1 Tax=Mangrovibacterium sp. TaxID=1961364 RepID=UPI003569D607
MSQSTLNKKTLSRTVLPLTLYFTPTVKALGYSNGFGRVGLFTFFQIVFLFFNTHAQVIQTYTTPGAQSFTVPAGVTQITVEAWGGGGAGGGSTHNSNGGGSGGGGGGYCTQIFTVTTGQVISFTVGSGGIGTTGNDGTAGTATSILTLQANGGGGGLSDRGTYGSGGAATGGSTNTIGENGTTGSNSTGGNGGDGANGGAGGSGRSNGIGDNGAAPGGGGGGGEGFGNTPYAGGNGANGQVKITYTSSLPYGFWYKADAGVTGTSSVTAWADQSGNGKNASNTGSVSLVNNSINYNPSLLFSNVNRQFTVAGTSTAQGIIVVNKTPATSNDLSGLVGSDGDKGIRLSNSVNPLGPSITPYESWRGDNNSDDWVNTTTGGTGRINGVTDSDMLHSSKWHIANLTRYQALSGSYYLGGYYSGRSYSGNIAEVLAYPGTVTNQSQIESYLAIKYGISLPGNYLASDASTIWSSTSGYQNDVHGIGRDDDYGLNQRSSKSENPGTDILIIQSGTSFTSPTNAQTGTALSDKQFFITGHNNGSTTTVSALTTGINTIARKWYAQVSNSLPTESFQFNLSGTSFGTYCKIGVLIADDASLTTNRRFVEGTLNSSTLTVNNLAITGNKYFTVATLATPSVGAIGTSQTICHGSTPNVSSTTNGSGFGTISYLWESSLDGSTWSSISGATSSTYSPGALTQTTYYRRKTVATLGTISCTSAVTASVVYTVRPVFTSGTISSTGETICSGTVPTTQIGSTTAASGGDNSITYQWQYSTDNTFATGVTTVTNNSASYTPTQTLTQTTYYRRQAKDGTCNTSFAASANVWTVTVNALPSTPTTTGAQICVGSPSTTLSASGAVSGQVYKWYDAATNGNLVKTSANNTDNTYSTPALSATTNYWVAIQSNEGCDSPRQLVTATMPSQSSGDQNAAGTDAWIGHFYKRLDLVNSPPSDANAFTDYYGQSTETETFDRNFNSSCFSVTSGAGTNSIYPDYFAVRYRMTSSREGIYVVNIASDDGARLTVDGFKVYDQWRQRGYTTDQKILFELTGTSNLMFEFYESSGGNRVSFLNLEKVPNSITTTDLDYCVSDVAATISGNNAFTDSPISSTSGFTVAYQWQSSADGSSGWTDVSGATLQNYTPPTTTAGTVYYRRSLTVSKTNLGSIAVSAEDTESGVVKVTVTPETAIVTHPSSSGETVCLNGSFTPLSVSATGSSLAYQWYENTTASTSGGTLLSGATAASYAPLATIAGTSYYYCIVSGTCGSVTSSVSGAYVVSSPASPTGTSPQNFCSGSSYSVSDLVASGTGILWYTSSSGGTALDPATELTSGTYYASQTVGGCESTDRLSVSVAVVADLSATGVVTNSTCASANDGIISITSSFDPSVSYSWIKADDLSFSASSKDLSDLSAGEYILTVSEGVCSQQTSFIVGIDDRVATIDCPVGSTVTCYSELPTIASIESFEAAGGTITSSCNGTTGLSLTVDDVIVPRDIDTSTPCSVERTFTVWDGSTELDHCLQIFTLSGATAPYFSDVDGSDYLETITSSMPGCLLEIPLPDFLGACSGVTYSYSLTAGGSVADLVLDTESKLLSGTFPEDDYTIEWTITDVCGSGSATAFQDIIVSSPTITYDGGSTSTAVGSGVKPMLTSTHSYEVDGGTAEGGFSYTWGLFVNDGGALGAAVDVADYTITPTNDASITIRFNESIDAGNYIISLTKTNTSTLCTKQETLAVAIQENTFDVSLAPFGNHCQAGETDTPSKITWEITFEGNGTEPFSFDYTINWSDESSTIDVCSGTVEDISQSSSSLTHTSGCLDTGSYPFAVVSKADGSLTVKLEYTLSSKTAKNFTVNIVVSATDQFAVSEVDQSDGDNSETLESWGVPNTSEIQTD